MKIKLSAPSASVKMASLAQLGSKMIAVAMQLIITMVLARLLTPEEYGVVAILTVFSSFFSILADAGISTAIAQFQDLDREDYERLFYLSMLLGVALTIVFALLSFAISWFYGNRIYIPLGMVLSLAVLFNALNMVPNGVLIKEKKFALIGMRLIICTLVVGILVIGLAFAGLGCFAIVLNTVLTSAFVLIWNLSTAHLKMSAGDVKPILRKVGGFSFYQFGHEAIVWLSGNADSLVAGKMFGPAALGYYNKAYQLYGYPNSILAAPITSTLIPFLSPLQSNLDALRKKFQSVMKKISFICAFCTAGMSVCAPEIIKILFGDAWDPAAPLLAVLSLGIYARGMNSVQAPLMSAVNKPNLLMRSTMINTVMTLVLIMVGGVLGTVESLATCVAIAYNMELIVPLTYSAHNCLKMSLPEYAKNLLPDILSVVATLVLYSIFPISFGGVVARLLAKGTFVCVTMLIFRVSIGKIMHV